MTNLEAETKQLFGLMTAIMSAGVVISMLRGMELATIRECLGRDPTAAELWYYEDQMYWRNLVHWQQDWLSSYQKIRKLVWGK